MGACCSKEVYRDEYAPPGAVAPATVEHDYEKGYEEDDDVVIADHGARVRLQGASRYVSMYTQQGRKGINQDAMTVWEEFAGDKDMFFCGVFDGHGPYGHKVSRYVRDTLPSRISSAIKSSQISSLKTSVADAGNGDGDDCNEMNTSKDGQVEEGKDGSVNHHPHLPSWQAGFTKAFRGMDEELSVDASIDSFCSGSTAVNVVKRGNHLIIANLGDSRAVLCTKGPKNQLVPVQLTVDLKPNVASEARRVQNCNGRIFALPGEPEVSRIWMPNEDCPGLAMARAFGDFCLKEYGLISVPQVFYRRLTSEDEFVVLATDGIWDVLTNLEVIRIVASAKQRSMAARMLVKIAVHAWRSKYPGSKVDDCAVVCLFLKSRTVFYRTYSDVSRLSAANQPEEVQETESEVSHASINCSEIATIAQRPRRVDSNERLDATKEDAPHVGTDRVVSNPKLLRSGHLVDPGIPINVGQT